MKSYPLEGGHALRVKSLYAKTHHLEDKLKQYARKGLKNAKTFKRGLPTCLHLQQ